MRFSLKPFVIDFRCFVAVAVVAIAVIVVIIKPTCLTRKGAFVWLCESAHKNIIFSQQK